YADYTVTAVGDNAFAWCSGLTQITIPATVQTLGLNLLQRTSGVTTLTIADGADPLYFTYEQDDKGEMFSFQELANSCTNLYLGRNVEVQSSLEWATPVFHSWSEIKHVIFGEYVTEIPLAFCQYARSLQSVQINTPNPLPAGQRTFAYITEDPIPAPQFITLYVPEGQKAQYEQMDLWKLMTIEEMDIEKRYSIKWVDGMWDFQVGGLFYKKGAVTTDGVAAVSVVMPQVWYLNPDGSYVSQWSSEFPYKQSKIEIPSQITAYDDSYGETITYPVVAIGDYAFRGAKNLEELIIPTSVTAVGAEIVEYTPNLKKLSIPESVIKVGWLAFARSGASEVSIPASASKWYDECCAFQESENLRTVTFAEGLTLIPARMFFGCTAIQQLYIPDNVSEIGEGAFSRCTGLGKIHLPASLETLHNRMFHGCPLRELEVPAGVKTIEESALLGTLLTKLTVNSGNKLFDSRDNCNAVIRTKDNTMVAACNGSFIPESVDSIAYEAFAELDGIRSITLPKNLKHVAPQAFMNLNNLTIITSYIENPAGVLAESAFESWYGNTYETATLYVPAGTLAAYKADSEWSKFKNIIEMAGANKPADVSDLKPVTTEGNASFTALTAETDLTNAVVDNLYITCDTVNGDGYDAEEKALVLNTIVDEVMLQNVLQNEGNMDMIRNNFTGIILEIPAGEGSITIEAKVSGERNIAVRISGKEADVFSPATKQALTINFNELKSTLVYIYGIFAEQTPLPATAPTKVKRMPARLHEEANNVSIYGASWKVKETPTGMKQTSAGANVQKVLQNGQVYILRDGKRYNLLGAEAR
ncbi:MAG: leucine-rich repeat protein, partial [Paludibacteraceae bacterium]|nr:leucine-rich repeat protein [Paludibacteraceae bacterium]